MRGKPHIERALESVASLFAQFVSGYLGRSAEFRGHGAGNEPLWPLMELQGLLDEWLIACFSDRSKINMCFDLVLHVMNMSATQLQEALHGCVCDGHRSVC